jgi:TusA-related sulfurtransferase
MRIVDTKSQQCPAPLIATKRAFKETKTGDSLQVITDSQNALNNISRFLKDNKIEFWIEEKESIWTITITKANTSAGNIIKP